MRALYLNNTERMKTAKGFLLIKEEKEMSVETSKMILKVFGIIAIVFGALALWRGILTIIGGGLLGVGFSQMTDDVAGGAWVGGLLILTGIDMIISAIVTLLEGIFSVLVAKDSSKIMPAFVVAIISLAFGVIGLIRAIVSGSGIFSGLISLAISCLIFLAANTIRKNG